LICAKNALRFASQLACVKEGVKSIDEALKELSVAPWEVAKKTIELHTDVELLAEIQKRLSSRSPAMA
jgi:hypothetical protein